MILFDFNLKIEKRKRQLNDTSVSSIIVIFLLLLQLILDQQLQPYILYLLELFELIDQYLVNLEVDHHFSDVLRIVYSISHVLIHLIQEGGVLRHDWSHEGVRSVDGSNRKTRSTRRITIVVEKNVSLLTWAFWWAMIFSLLFNFASNARASAERLLSSARWSRSMSRSRFSIWRKTDKRSNRSFGSLCATHLVNTWRTNR